MTSQNTTRRLLLAALALAVALDGPASARADHHGEHATPERARTAARPAAPQGPAQPESQPAPPATASDHRLPDVSQLVERVGPFVVSVTTTQAIEGRDTADVFEHFFGPGERPDGPPTRRRRQGLGSGIIIDSSGLVVTNAHVVEGAAEIRIQLHDGREFDAEVVGRDAGLDIALLELEGAEGLPSATLGSSERLRVGEPVIAMGNPFGLGHTVTTGIVSGKGRIIGLGPFDDFIQTDASINPGNSGGPLFNARGEVVGINAVIRAGAAGIGFAIPIDGVKEVIPELREHGRVERGRLGVVVQPVTRELAQALGLDTPHGALVAEVEKGGPAARGGMLAGDVIVSVAGVAVDRSEQLPRIIARHRPGSALRITVVRESQERSVEVRLGTLSPEEPRRRPARERPPADAVPELGGVELSDVAEGGARVVRIPPGAHAGDLEVGDVILELGGQKIKTIDELRRALRRAEPGSVAVLRVRRGDTGLFAAVPVGPERSE